MMQDITDDLIAPLPPGTTVAATEVGYLGDHASQINVIDLAGLNDTDIALHGFDTSRFPPASRTSSGCLLLLQLPARRNESLIPPSSLSTTSTLAPATTASPFAKTHPCAHRSNTSSASSGARPPRHRPLRPTSSTRNLARSKAHSPQQLAVPLNYTPRHLARSAAQWRDPCIVFRSAHKAGCPRSRF